jgi:hypothetical protein
MERYKTKAGMAALVVLAFAVGIFSNVGHGTNAAAFRSIEHAQSAIYVASDVTPTPEPTPTSGPDMEPGGGSGTGG